MTTINKKLPLVELTFTDDGSPVKRVGLVDDPAIGETWLTFNKQKQNGMTANPSERYVASVNDSMKKNFAGGVNEKSLHQFVKDVAVIAKNTYGAQPNAPAAAAPSAQPTRLQQLLMAAKKGQKLEPTDEEKREAREFREWKQKQAAEKAQKERREFQKKMYGW